MIRTDESEKPLLVSFAEAGRLLGVGERIIWDMAQRGTIMKVKVGRRSLIPRAELERIAAGR
jgi:excisionase family DNA binding protein